MLIIDKFVTHPSESFQSLSARSFVSLYAAKSHKHHFFEGRGQIFSEGPKFFRGVRVDLPAPSRPAPALEQGICHPPGPARKPGGTF